MAKQRTRKSNARLPKARHIGGEDAEKEVAALLARLGGEQEDELAELAREELKRIAFGIAGAAMQWAREGGKDGRDAGRSLWAGQFLAELLSVLEKRADWVAENSRPFKNRRAELSRLRDLQAKPSGLSPCMGYVLAAYGRVIEIVRGNRVDFWRDVWEEVAKRMNFSEQVAFEEFPMARPPSDQEKNFPALVEDIERAGGDSEAAWFKKVIWPLLCERKEEIMADERIKQRLSAERKRRELANDSFSTIKSDFQKAWRTLYRKPGGRLVGIERERMP